MRTQDRITFARELRGLSKRDLSARLELTPATITNYESGESVPSADVIARLAVALELPTSFFDAFEAPPATSELARYRKLSTASKRDMAQMEATVRLHAASFEALTEVVTPPEFDPDRWDFGPPESLSDGEILELAREVRAAVAPPARPLPNVMLLAEQRGILVMLVDLPTERVHGVTLDTEARPYIAVNRQRGTAASQRFTVAHELGHIALHRGRNVDRHLAERQANLFAAGVLMPDPEFTELLANSPTPQRYVQLKARWRVSVQAQIRAARDRDLISDTRYKSQMTEISRLGWRRSEPLDGTMRPDAPTFPDAVARALASHGINWRDVLPKHLHRRELLAPFGSVESEPPDAAPPPPGNVVSFAEMRRRLRG